MLVMLLLTLFIHSWSCVADARLPSQLNCCELYDYAFHWGLLLVFFSAIVAVLNLKFGCLFEDSLPQYRR